MRRGTLWVVVVGVAGCDGVFDLERLPDVAACKAPVDHDEDGDGIDDACDRCPMVRDVNDPDGEGDGVGDACDPDPMDECDTRLLFDGFVTHRPALVVTGDWFVAGDNLIRPFPGEADAIAHYAESGTFTNVHARAGALVTGFEMTGVESHVAIATGVQLSADVATAGYKCALRRTQTQYNVQIDDVSTGTVRATAPVTGDPTSELVIEIDNRSGAPITCEINGTKVQGSAIATGLAEMTVGEVMFSSDDVSVHIRWFDVIGNHCL